MAKPLGDVSEVVAVPGGAKHQSPSGPQDAGDLRHQRLVLDVRKHAVAENAVEAGVGQGQLLSGHSTQYDPLEIPSVLAGKIEILSDIDGENPTVVLRQGRQPLPGTASHIQYRRLLDEPEFLDL